MWACLSVQYAQVPCLMVDDFFFFFHKNLVQSQLKLAIEISEKLRRKKNNALLLRELHVGQMKWFASQVVRENIH